MDLRHEHIGGGIVTEGLAHVSEYVYVGGTEDEASAELKRILAQPVLAVSGGAGSSAGLAIVRTKKVQDVCTLQACRTIGHAVFVDQKRERDSSLFPKEASVGSVAQSNRSQIGSFLREFLLVFAQLRDVLTAEDSSIVTKEHHHGGLRFPKRAEPDFPAVCVGQDDPGERFAE